MSYYFLYHKKGVPTWLAYFLILVLTIGLTLAFGGKPNRIVSRASKNLIPKNITIGNITSESATVLFTTQESFISNLVMTQPNGESQIFFDYRDQSKQTPRSTHYFVLSGLTRNTVYRFRIYLENKELAREYEFRTLAMAFPTLSNAPVFGKILLKNLEPASEVLVRVKVGNTSEYFTALSKQTGEWLISFPILLDTYGEETTISETTPLTLEFMDGNHKKTLVKVKYTDSQPLRTIILGKSYDFTLPNSVLGINTKNSARLIGFPRNNAVVNSFTPTFRGKGTPNTLLKLTLEPEVADLLVSVDGQGEWKFTPEIPLSPGRYQLFLKEKKVQESVSFTIGKSGESVLGDATPSATITLRPTTSPTTLPQTSITPSPTRVQPTATLKPSLLTPTIIRDQIPELGVNNNLVILFASGLSLLGLFLVLY